MSIILYLCRTCNHTHLVILTGGSYLKVMLKAGKYDLVHEFFGKMKKNGAALKALTYKGSTISVLHTILCVCVWFVNYICIA